MKMIRPEAVDDLIARYQKKYDGLRQLLKNQDLPPDDEAEVNGQLHEVGHFLEDLEELAKERMNYYG